MANNIVFEETKTLSLVCTEPAAPNAGDPVRFGNLTGVALDDENAAGTTVVKVGTFVVDLPVTDHVGGGIAVGDSLFYVSATDALENDSAGYFFGFALEIVGAGLTTTINVLHVPSPAAGALGAGTVGAANIAAGAITAANGGLAAGAVDTAAKVANGILTTGKVAESADADVLGALPVLYHATIADASADTSIVVTNKVRVVDFWIVNTGIAAHAADDHVQLFNGGDAISDEVVKTATVNAVKRAATLDPAHTDIADGGTMKFTAVKSTNVACEAYVLAYRIA